MRILFIIFKGKGLLHEKGLRPAEEMQEGAQK